jgi:hypothetical protein
MRMKNAFLVKGDRVSEEIAPTVTKEIENFRVDLIGVGPGGGVRPVLDGQIDILDQGGSATAGAVERMMRSASPWMKHRRVV